ncbi:MAG: zinc dependent phospholipase C family protein [Brumimicrobium sp.]|nr:zinc dependent phospholipase C family protein [Brumimicrobium sp.]
MKNWLIYSISAAFTATFLLTSFRKEVTEEKHAEHGSCQHALWGFFGHKRINRIAVFTLPPEMFGFYKEHIEYITEHAVDPDKRRYAVEGEAPRHYIDIDHYVPEGENPFLAMPRKWEEAVEKYSEDTLQTYGIVPWYIPVMKQKLTWAFKEKNVDLILKYSADLGHYIGDAHVPLHTTENYNGKMTNQRGIHGFWESRLPEINADQYNFFVGKAKYEPNVLDFAWDAVEQSHYALDSVFRFEKELTEEFPPDKKYSFEQRGATTVRVYSYEFSQAYHEKLNGMVERRMRQSIIAVGSIWYTAWVDAGQPDLNELVSKKPSEELIEAQKELDAQFLNSQAKGRICD